MVSRSVLGRHGWGNAHDTARFAAEDSDQMRVLLIVHSWRSATPTAKFVVINLPFDTLNIQEITIKKHQRVVISAVEQDVLRSYDLKAACYITKPIDLDEFISVVRSIESFWLSIVRLPH